MSIANRGSESDPAGTRRSSGPVAENAPISLFAAVDRIRHPARGREGGQPGTTGRITLSSGRELAGKGEQTIPPGERLVFETPGGGGYGDPRARDAALVEADLRAGLVSPQGAARDYGLEP